jgi:hypothetical protein
LVAARRQRRLYSFSNHAGAACNQYSHARK